MNDFTKGLMSLASPSAWGPTLESGNALQIIGLLAVPAFLLWVVMGSKTQYRYGQR